MNEHVVIPTDQDMKKLQETLSIAKQQLEIDKRKEEYQKLSEELESTMYKTINKKTEFDSAMRLPDTDFILKTKRKNKTFSEHVIERFTAMCNLRPVTGHVIAIIICLMGIFATTHWVEYLITNIGHTDYGWVNNLLNWMSKNPIYAVTGFSFAICWTIFKSAARSMGLPLLAAIIGTCVAAYMIKSGASATNNNESLFYLALAITGWISLIRSSLSID